LLVVWVAVGDCCWFLIVGCRFRLSFSLPVVTVSVPKKLSLLGPWSF